MTEIQATLERATEVQPVPDSDNLDVINVSGFPVVVRRGSINENDHVVYFPPDLEVPPFVSQVIGVTDYLRKAKIVKAVRLRGQLSMGIALPLGTPGFERLVDHLQNASREAGRAIVGESLDWYFGTRKFLPVINEQTKNRMGQEMHSHPLLTRYTEIKRWERYPHYFNQDERVVITEKLHGTNCRIACIGGEIIVGSHNTQRAPLKLEEESLNNFYWFPLSIPGVREMLTALGESYGQVILFGETYGKGVQGGFDYSTDELAFAAFDLLLNGVYADYKLFEELTNKYEVPTVPVDFIGELKEEYVTLFRDAPSWLTKTHIREGIVIKPAQERTQGVLGRLILKALNPEYLIKKSSGKVEDIPIE
jgi:RNA ligase (TIGR02306 family)